MINTDKLLEVIQDRFGVTIEEIQSQNRHRDISYPRKLIAYFLRNQRRDCHRITGRKMDVTRQWIYQIRALLDYDQEIIEDCQHIYNLIQPEMSINLNRSQLISLMEMISIFLDTPRDNVTLELICLHLDDIREKLRKRIRADKKNLSLDDKQVHAFLIWHYHFGGHFEKLHPHGYMTLIDIINQLKPINHAQRIPIAD